MLRCASSAVHRVWSIPLASLSRPQRRFMATKRDNIMSIPLDQVPQVHPAVRTALSLDNASRSQMNAFHISNTVKKYGRSESDTGSPEVQGKCCGGLFLSTTRALGITPATIVSRRIDSVSDFDFAFRSTSSLSLSVAVLTERIKSLTEHLKVHRKDRNTERNVVKLVHKRRGMIRYLLRKSPGTRFE